MNARTAPLLGVLVLGGAFALTGCGPTDAESEESPTPRPTRTSTATPTPSAGPTEGPVEPVGTPLGHADAYGRCVAIVSQSLYPDRPVTPAPLSAADVIDRPDGLIYVYTEVTVEDAPDAAQRDIAYECVHGGTLEEPEDYIYGAVVRSPLSQRDPNMGFGED